MKRSLACLAVLIAWLPAPAQGQDDPNVRQVLRREDRRGVIVHFAGPVARANAPRNVSRFSMMDVTAGTLVPLDTLSVVSPQQCPQITTPVDGQTVGPRDRLCLELRPGAAPLDDQHAYVLLTDNVPLQSGTVVAPVMLRMPPVSGAVVPIKDLTRRIEVTFSRELAGDATIRPSVKVNGRPAALEQNAQTPPCYNVGSLTFQCQLQRPLEHGNVVEFDLVQADGQSAGYGPVVKTTVAATLPEKADQIKNFQFSVALSRLNDETNGSFTFKTVEGGLTREIGRVGGRAYLELAPHADILVTTKTDGSGRLSLGPQVRLNAFVVPGTTQTSLQATPRFEADDKNVRHNWMYLDAEAVLYIRPLYRGTFLGGARQIFPRVGYERGTTGRGGDSVAIESNDPSRWTAGASLVLHWGEGVLPFLPAGVDVTADYDHLWIRRNPAYIDPPTGSPSYWSVSGTLRVAKNFGITATRRSGRRPPLFRFQNGLEIGASFLY